MYSYDADGNQTTVTTKVGSAVKAEKSMSYDLFNRMLSWELKKLDAQDVLQVEKSEAYTYRGDKWQRSSMTTDPQKDSEPVAVNFLYDGDNVVADISGGSVVKSYVAPMLDSYVSMTDHSGATTETYWYSQDSRQSVRNLTNATGAVVTVHDYTVMGERTETFTHASLPATAPVQRHTYTGRELNPHSGDYYFRYRTYGAGIGGFFSRDPLDYVDCMSLYGGHFAAFIWMDPEGRAVLHDECQMVADNLDIFIGSQYGALIDVLKKNDCKVPKVECRCCGSDESGAAWFDPRTGNITVCENRDISGPWLPNLMAHELIHAYDNCAGVGWDNCNRRACSEIRAYHQSGQCNPGSPWLKKGEGYDECVKRLAASSTSVLEKCSNPKEIVEDMFKPCMKLTAPFNPPFR